jgi:hypothetical protein
LLLFSLVEEPVQRAVLWRPPQRLVAGLVASTLVAVGAAVMQNLDKEPAFIDVEAIEQGRKDFFEDLPTTLPGVDPTPAGGSSTSSTEPPDPTQPIDVQRVMLVGDSNGWTASFWLKDHPEELPWQFKWWSGTGCGTTSDGITRGRNEPDGPLCPGWLGDLGAAIQAYDPDVVIVVSLAGDLAEHDVGDGVWRTIGDPIYDAYLERRMEEFVDLVGATGARIGWFTYPDYAVIDRATGRLGTGPSWRLNDPEAVAQLNAMIADLAERDPRVVTVPFREWAETWPGGQLDTTYRPDGAHLDGTREDVARWIIEQVAVVAAAQA